MLNKAQETRLYQKAKENLYPFLAPYADPVYNKVVSSTYYNAAVQHLTPVAWTWRVVEARKIL